MTATQDASAAGEAQRGGEHVALLDPGPAAPSSAQEIFADARERTLSVLASGRCSIVGAMCVWDVLLDVWQNGGQVVVLGGAGYVATSARAAPSQVRSNDRRVDALSRDLRRWIHDRDRELSSTLKLIEAYARNPELEGPFVDQLVALRAPVPDELKHLPAGSQYHSAAHVQWQVDAKETALHQDRDRATETIDELDSIKESEGRLHRIVRKRLGLAAPEVKLSSPSSRLWARWRADVDLGDGLPGAVTDASRASGETRLRQLEAHGENHAL